MSSGNIPICRPWPGVPSMLFCTSSHSVNSPKRLGRRVSNLWCGDRRVAAARLGLGLGKTDRRKCVADATWKRGASWLAHARGFRGCQDGDGTLGRLGGDLIGRGSFGWLGVLLRAPRSLLRFAFGGVGVVVSVTSFFAAGALARARGPLAVSLEAFATVSFAVSLASLACATGAGFVRPGMTKAFAGALVGILLAFASAPTLLTSVSAMHEPDSTMESGRLIGYDVAHCATRADGTRVSRRHFDLSEFTTALSNLFPSSAASGRNPRARWNQNSDRLFLGFDGTRVAHRQTVTKFSRNRNRNRHAAGEGCWQS